MLGLSFHLEGHRSLEQDDPLTVSTRDSNR